MRQYLIGSWNNADSYDYSGEQLMGNRLGASREVPHFTASGKANVAKYGDNTEKKGPAIPITDRILPQKRRLNTLYEQMQELERSYRSGEININDYTLYRDIIVAKIQRQEVLYKRAASVRPTRPESEEVEAIPYANSSSNPSDNNGHGESSVDEIGVRFIDELSSDNSLKNILKKACKVIRTVRYCSHKVRNYWQELKEV